MIDAALIHGCIFDFDGTIIISEHVHMRAWEDLAREESLRLPSGFLEQSVGMSDRQLVKILCAAWHGAIPEDVLLTRKRDHYMERCPEECTLVPGVSDVIKSVADRGVPIALATSSSRGEVLPVLEQWKLLPLFRRLWTVEDVTDPKPAPEIYELAAKSLNLKPRECLAFEDSVAGVTSARAAGCHLVTIQTLYDAVKLGPAVMSVKDFTDERLRSFVNQIALRR